LNAQAVEWARRAKIAIHARRTDDREDAGGKPPRETVAHEGATARARAVAGMDRVVRAELEAKDALRVTEACARLGVPVLDAFAGRREAGFLVPLLNVPDWQDKRARLAEEARGACTLHEDRALVSVVGDGLGEALPRFAAALREAGVDCETLGATSLRLSAVIVSGDLAKAQRALHAAFVTT
jgi:aspartokinase